MATLKTLAPWVSRKATKNTGVNLVSLHHSFVANELKYSTGTDTLDTGEFVPIWEIPFGSVIVQASANIITATTNACTFEFGCYGFTSYDGTDFSNGSTGAVTAGVLTLINLTTAGRYATMGAQVGKKLDERVFTDSDELNKPLYLALKGITFTDQPDAGVWDLNVLLLCP